MPISDAGTQAHLIHGHSRVWCGVCAQQTVEEVADGCRQTHGLHWLQERLEQVFGCPAQELRHSNTLGRMTQAHGEAGAKKTCLSNQITTLWFWHIDIWAKNIYFALSKIAADQYSHEFTITNTHLGAPKFSFPGPSSLAPRRCGSNFRSIIFKFITWNSSFGICC